MELDSTAKLASIVSVTVGVIVSVASWYTNHRIQAAQDDLGQLIKQEKQVSVDRSKMELRKSEYDASARIDPEFTAPLANTFAEYYEAQLNKGAQASDRYIMPPGLEDEIDKARQPWSRRQGLMIGRPCDGTGLVARQVVVLALRHIGGVDATDVKLTALRKAPPAGQPTQLWREAGPSGQPLAYADLASATGWQSSQLPLPDLRSGQTFRVVLASVSGRTGLYGTVYVPVSIAWTDRVTRQSQTQPLLPQHAMVLNAELAGAEIGHLVAGCQKAP